MTVVCCRPVWREPLRRSGVVVLPGGANKESIHAISECNEESAAASDEKVSEKPAESDHACSNPIPCPDALLELKAIEDMVTDPFCMDLGRMKNAFGHNCRGPHVQCTR
ncbi:uncharacterized protein LOC125941813 [Dermacentor silvarum]|uniref:uncharacterized protein LOC125941813 n=1 Tax=Dermacentor silvarum TaxID=543639 RepID=UPI002101C663|nr:uncharacterized protein LOC125941813 [Dermacentor silvarum]